MVKYRDCYLTSLNILQYNSVLIIIYMVAYQNYGDWIVVWYYVYDAI